MSETQTPSQQIIAAAQQGGTIKDARGREICVRRVKGANLARLIRACGPAADIQTYFGLAVLRACVTSIDGRPVPFPQTAAAVDALFDLVDDDATSAVAEWTKGEPEAEVSAPLGGQSPAA